VLAPHPDDEVFGCGGAIASHVRSGTPVDVVILTDGAVFGDPDTRNNECLAAATVLGYGEPEFWMLPDRGLAFSEALAERISTRINANGIDLVYAPSPWEVHPDHRAASELAVEAVRRAGEAVRLAFYEVGAPLHPNLLLDISGFVATKQAAMSCFASQRIHQDYVRHISALNTFRTYTLSPEVIAAEAYWILEAGALDHFLATDGMEIPVFPGEPDILTLARANANRMRLKFGQQTERLDQLAKEIAVLQVQWIAIVRSRSWKLTAPLRQLKHLLSTVVHSLRGN
jgi:LmbE family N-acetylglucosaminyl deacetylase